MTFDEIVAARRSVRTYTDAPVGDDLLNQVLEAGRLAPSARNMQDWHFTAVKNEALRALLVQACMDQPVAKNAPVLLAVWSQSERVMHCGQKTSTVDCSIALTFMMLKATELGLGSCWLGLFDAGQAAAVLGLPANAEVVAVLALGHPAETPAPTSRKPMDEIADIRE